MKWDMGWMHDMLQYMSEDPVHRKYHHNKITFRMLYAWHENFVLPLSHDEVVHGKGSLLGKMAGMGWDEFANLRTLYGYMYGQAAKKLLFMGAEIGQRAEWSHESSLDWHLLENESHLGLQKWVRDLNHLYRSEPALHELDCEPDGFQWVDCNDAEQSTISFLRRGRSSDDVILVACNFTPVPRHNYAIGVPRAGRWHEMLNSDSREYWGQGFGNLGGVDAVPFGAHGQPCSVTITLPPLGVVFFKSEGGAGGEFEIEAGEPVEAATPPSRPTRRAPAARKTSGHPAKGQSRPRKKKSVEKGSSPAPATPKRKKRTRST
jgi:1,4-alpha-glucan branching enzyme